MQEESKQALPAQEEETKQAPVAAAAEATLEDGAPDSKVGEGPNDEQVMKHKLKNSLAGKADLGGKQRKQFVSVLGPDANRLTELNSQILDQHVVHQQAAKFKNEPMISIVNLNKYVGYSSKKVYVGLQLMVADCKALLFVKGTRKVQIFNVRLTVDRLAGSLEMAQVFKASIEQMSSFSRRELISVNTINLESADEVCNATTEVLNGVRANRFKAIGQGEEEAAETTPAADLSQSDAKAKEKWLRENFVKGNLKNKMCFPFSLRTKNRQYIMFTKLKADRDILLHDLNYICQIRNSVIEHVQAQELVMPQIDPITNFNAYSLSMITVAPSPEQQGFQTECTSRDTTLSQSHILKVDPQSIEYIRQGQRCYVSLHLRRELTITDGWLWKEPEEKALMKAKFYPTHACLDFKQSRLQFKESHDYSWHKQNVFNPKKSVTFSNILEARPLEKEKTIDGQNETPLGFVARFLVRTVKRDYVFWARNNKERQVWLDSLDRVLKINNHSAKGAPQAVAVPTSAAAASEQLIKTGGDENAGQTYKSDHMVVTKTLIRGRVMKAIENIKVYHKSKYHEKFFELNFGLNQCYFSDKQTDTGFSKAFKTDQIVSCRVLSEDEAKEKVQERERKRSSSFFRRALNATEKACPWNFGFVLKFDDCDRDFELYAPTRVDRDQWVRVLGAIADMHKAGLSISEMTPLEYLQEQTETAQIAQIEQQEANMTEAELQRREAEAQETLVENKVKLWFRLNLEKLLKTPQVAIEAYDSATMRLSDKEARAFCFQKRRNQDSKDITMFHCEFFMSFGVKLLMVQTMRPDQDPQKYTYSDIVSVRRLEGVQAWVDSDALGPDFVEPAAFELLLKGKTCPLSILCATSQDRDQWVRIYSLIIKMLAFGLESSALTLWDFEKYYNEQIAKEQSKFSAQPAQKAANSQGQELAAQGDSEVAQITGNSKRATTLSRGNAALKELKEEMGTLALPTMCRTARFIEGYLWKEKDSKALLSMARRHLRYFRIVFSSGKLNVKEDRADGSMRSFLLKDLLCVQLLTNQADQSQIGAIVKDSKELTKIMEKKEIVSLYKVNLYTEKCDWPFMFRIEFPARSFTLSARTPAEYFEWTRAFKLIDQMNKLGISLSDQNPFLFEKQQKEILDSSQAESKFSSRLARVESSGKIVKPESAQKPPRPQTQKQSPSKPAPATVDDNTEQVTVPVKPPQEPAEGESQDAPQGDTTNQLKLNSKTMNIASALQLVKETSEATMVTMQAVQQNRRFGGGKPLVPNSDGATQGGDGQGQTGVANPAQAFDPARDTGAQGISAQLRENRGQGPIRATVEVPNIYNYNINVHNMTIQSVQSPQQDANQGHGSRAQRQGNNQGRSNRGRGVDPNVDSDSSLQREDLIRRSGAYYQSDLKEGNSDRRVKRNRTTNNSQNVKRVGRLTQNGSKDMTIDFHSRASDLGASNIGGLEELDHGYDDSSALDSQEAGVSQFKQNEHHDINKAGGHQTNDQLNAVQDSYYVTQPAGETTQDDQAMLFPRGGSNLSNQGNIKVSFYQSAAKAMIKMKQQRTDLFSPQQLPVSGVGDRYQSDQAADLLREFGSVEQRVAVMASPMADLTGAFDASLPIGEDFGLPQFNAQIIKKNAGLFDHKRQSHSQFATNQPTKRQVNLDSTSNSRYQAHESGSARRSEMLRQSREQLKGQGKVDMDAIKDILSTRGSQTKLKIKQVGSKTDLMSQVDNLDASGYRTQNQPPLVNASLDVKVIPTKSSFRRKKKKKLKITRRSSDDAGEADQPLTPTPRMEKFDLANDSNYTTMQPPHLAFATHNRQSESQFHPAPVTNDQDVLDEWDEPSYREENKKDRLQAGAKAGEDDGNLSDWD